MDIEFVTVSLPQELFMSIEVSYEGDSSLISIAGDIDSSMGEDLNNVFQQVMDNSSIKSAQVDMSGVKSINSSGIGKILKFYKHFEKIGGKFGLINLPEKIKTLFEEIHLDKIIPMS
jgi:anti-anti-sigma factor